MRSNVSYEKLKDPVFHLINGIRSIHKFLDKKHLIECNQFKHKTNRLNFVDHLKTMPIELFNFKKMNFW